MSVNSGDERTEFLSQSGVSLEQAVVIICHGCRILLFDTTHLHAEMFGGAADDHPLGRHGFGKQCADLRGQTFLDLKPTGEIIDDTRKLRKPYHFAVRDVSDRYFSEEWQYMMLAHAVEFNILDNHHA